MNGITMMTTKLLCSVGSVNRRKWSTALFILFLIVGILSALLLEGSLSPSGWY
jgi:hypothetical protein